MNEVNVYLCCCSAIAVADSKPFLEIMSSEEQQRNARFRFERDQHRDRIARALLRSVLAEAVGQTPQSMCFVKGEHGKPDLDRNVHQLDHVIEFNLSHSGDWVALAVANERVGIDIENVNRKNDVLAIADRYFYGQELEELQSFPLPERCRRFFDYWTLKEAYMKARGEGISLGLSNFGFSLRSEPISIHMTDVLNDHPSQWQFQCSALAEQSLDAGHSNDELSQAGLAGLENYQCAIALNSSKPMKLNWQLRTAHGD